MKQFSEYTQRLLNDGAQVGHYPDEDHDFLIVPAYSNMEDGPDFERALSELTGYNPEEDYDFDFYGFSDEYTTCSECCNVVRTSPASYHWIPDFWVSCEYGIVCGDCVRDNLADEYIADLVESHQDTARGCHLLNPADYGFTLVLEGLENGMHPGQADDPLAIQEWANNNGLAVLWTVKPSQFDCEFDGYIAWRECPDCKGNDWPHCERCRHTRDVFVPLNNQEKAVILDTLVSEVKDYGCIGRVTYLKPDYRESPDLATRMEKALKSLSKPFAKIHNDGSVDEYDTVEEMYPHLKGEIEK